MQGFVATPALAALKQAAVSSGRAWSSVTFNKALTVATVRGQSKGWLGPMANAAKASSQLKVLYGEGDPETLAAQSVSIQKAGHRLETAVGRKGVEEALRKGTFDLLILGGTLSRNDRHHLPYAAKKASGEIRVLVLHTDGERHPYVDGNVDTGRSIEELLAKVPSLWSAAQAAPGGRSRAATAGK